jgi:hypothetical protein
MRRIRRNAKFLQALARGNSKTRKRLIKKANRSQLCSICEIAKNVGAGKLKGKLCKFKRLLKTLSNRNISHSQKKKLLTQKGGLPILPLILGAVSPLIGKLVSKLVK